MKMNSGFNKRVRVVFPLLQRKNGKPKKRQPPIPLFLNGYSFVIRRGIVVEIPYPFLTLCDKAGGGYEYFVSSQTVKE